MTYKRAILFTQKWGGFLNINEIVTATLRSVGLNVYFINKPNDEVNKKVSEYLTFNYLKVNDWYSNDVSEITKHTVTINHVTNKLSDVVLKQSIISDSLLANERVTDVRYLQSIYNNESNEYIGVYTCSIYSWL